MEAFSLLKYWRASNSNGNGVSGGGGGVSGDNAVNVRTTTIVSGVAQHDDESNGDDDDDDDGPFFDLEFSAVNTDGDDVEDDGSDGDGDGDESEFKFTLSDGDGDGDGGGRSDQNLPLSPSDDLFFNGTLVPMESSSLAIDTAELVQNSKHLQFPVSLLKSATKFRVFMLGLKKSKSLTTFGKIESNRSGSASPKQESELKSQESELKSRQSVLKSQQSQQESKFFTVKFKVDEVPIVSLFTRDTSRSASNNPNKQNSEESDQSAAATDQEKLKFSKEVMQKYLNKVKPLYIRASKRYGEKLKFSGPLNLISAVKLEPTNKSEIATEAEPNAKEAQAKGNIPAGLRVVKKHLGKSRSATSAVAAAPSPAPTKRRDDSLLQQQDGIQSAIMHCKRSFNASRDSEKPVISRCVSDSSNEKSIDSTRKCTEKVMGK